MIDEDPSKKTCGPLSSKILYNVINVRYLIQEKQIILINNLIQPNLLNFHNKVNLFIQDLIYVYLWA